MTEIFAQGEESGIDWLIWRPVVQGKASLAEVEEKWSVVDCFRFLVAVEIQAEADEYRMELERELQRLKG